MSRIEILENLEKSVESIAKHNFLTRQMRASLHLTLARFIDKVILNGDLSEFQVKCIENICKLIDKNKTVFDNNLISSEEYNTNGKKLLSKLIKILNPSEKKKKASKIDVYSLRAAVLNIENEN